MFSSLAKIVLSPVDIAFSATKDIVDVVTVNDKKELGEETGAAFSRLGENLEKAFDPD